MSIRLRFTIWAAAIMLGIFLSLSFGIHYMMERNLQNEMDQRVTTTYNTLRTNIDLYYDPQRERFVIGVRNPEPFAAPGLYIQILDPDYTVVSKTENLGSEVIPITPEILDTNRNGQARYFNEEVAGSALRVYSAPVYLTNGDFLAYIQVAESREPLSQTLKQLTTILTAGTLLGTILAAGAAWLIADAALRPLRRMAATARAIGGAGDLSERLASPQTNDEVERLAETFNAMLDRLEIAFDSHRQFVADASHELRTPLTALRGNTDILQTMVRENRIDTELLTESLDDIGSETDRMGRLVGDLLALARADIGWSPDLEEEIDLAMAAAEAVRIHRPLAQEHDLQLEIEEDGVLVRGNADQVRQLVLILLDNAYTHTPPGTKVVVRVAAEGDDAIIAVSDNGPGFGAEHRERIFDRFYRTDGARARSSGGTGLGLAIARWIAEIHGGTITAESVPGEGATFTVRIPLEDEHYQDPAASDVASQSRMPANQTARGIRI
ncbi:HAMP domain-containing sensor histidine kinase [soil metagenome]